MSSIGTKDKGKAASGEVEKVCFRLFPPYTAMVAEKAKAAGVTPNQFARVAVMAFADKELLNVHERMNRIENELIRFRKDFVDALEPDD